MILYFQVEEDGQISRATQAEQDQYEMQVRAANIVSGIGNIWFNVMYVYVYNA